jgi:Zn-dependent protease with chaperone function
MSTLMKNKTKNIFFLLISTLFAIYLTVVVLVSDKLVQIWPSTIELINYCNNIIENWSSVYTTPNGILQLLILGLLVLLAGRFIYALTQTVRKIVMTNRYLASLVIVGKHQQVNIIATDKFEAFTGGFLRPQVYVSQKLLTTLSGQEVEAVINHEQAHRSAYDPLRQLFIDCIAMMLPLPGKHIIVKHYQLLTELSADRSAIDATKSRKAVISALFKLMNETTPHYALGYNTTSERLAILINQKTVSNRRLFASIASLIMLMVVFSGSLLSTSISLPLANDATCKQPWQINFSSNLQSSVNRS